MTEGFTIRNDLVSTINSGQFRAFAKSKGIDAQGIKNNLVRNINSAIQNNQLNRDDLRAFLQEQIWFGKNKHHYYIQIDEESISVMKDKHSLVSFFAEKGLAPHNEIDDIYLMDGISLSRFEFELENENGNQVQKVFIGFTEKNYIQRFEDQTPVFEAVNTYICTEIDLRKNTLLLRIRSQSALKPIEDVNEKSINANYLAKKYMEHLSINFGLEYLDGAAEEMKNKMYKIEKGLTTFIELQFQPRVLANSKLIFDFTTHIAEVLGLPSDKNPIDLRERITGLLERALIANNKGVVERYVEGKKGYVNMFDFRDDSGGRINARSDIRGNPIQTSDIFFDTRETINEVKLLDAIWIVWFRTLADINENILENTEDDDDTEFDDESVEEQRKIIRIKTRIVAFKGFYKIEFKRYVLKEEYDHVLSEIESFI